MRNINTIPYIRYIYFAALTVLLLLVLFTPTLIHDGFSVVTEEMLEGICLLIITIAGFIIYSSLERHLRETRSKYDDLARHVGALNLQTVQVEALFDEITKLPENKRDIKKILKSIALNVLSVITEEWVLVRIIDKASGRTLTEHIEVKDGSDTQANVIPTISNKAILTDERAKEYSVYTSRPENTRVIACCVFPTHSLNKHQEVVIKAAVNSLAIIYLVFEK